MPSSFRDEPRKKLLLEVIGMTKSAQVILKRTLICVGSVLALVALSAFRAYKTSCDYVRDSIPPPFYSTRFVLHPNHYVDGAPELGFRPGWLVTYAPRSKNYGTAISVSLLGSVLGAGTPTIVSKERQKAINDLGKFQQAFAQVDAAIHAGMTFSNAAAILRVPPIILTNSDDTIDAYYPFMPRAIRHISVDWLTNGITLHVSNGIVTRKTYSYTSSR